MYTSVVQCIHAEKFAIDLGADHLTFEGVMGDFRLRLTSREKKIMQGHTWQKKFQH